MTLILPEFNKKSIYSAQKMSDIESIAKYLKDLDQDIQKLMVALRPDRVVTLVDASSIATDVSNAIHFRVNLTAAVGATRTLANPTNPRDGQRVVWEFVQETGAETVTLDTKFVLGTDISALTLSTTAGAIDFMGCVYDSSNDKWRVVAFVTGY